MNYSLFRSSESNPISANVVTVNHKALITRTLTKYPVDYALFRELVQNGADAGASTVRISFTTNEGLRKESIADTIKDATVKGLQISNNGSIFQSSDWKRLREIASGNPDESKIGAFGVGFYSVFSVTEEPLVHSGDSMMCFFYIKDQLNYRFTDKTPTHSEWTIIDLPYSHNDQNLPDLSGLTAFLTQSLTFIKVSNLQILVDDILVYSFSKTSSPSKSIPISSHISPQTPNKTLKLTSLASQDTTISLSYFRFLEDLDYFSRDSTYLKRGLKLFSNLVTNKSDPKQWCEGSVNLVMVTGEVTVNISTKFSNQIKQAVLKAPPKKSSISFLYKPYTQASDTYNSYPMLSHVFPSSGIDSKIFIGFPTKQSTGFSLHIHAPHLIPTMERTAVDLSNTHVCDWNKDMLALCGIVLCSYYTESANSTPQDLGGSEFTKYAGHIISQFTTGTSSPDKAVGYSIAMGFWNASKNFPLPTNDRFVSNALIRVSPDPCSFLKGIHLLNKDLQNKYSSFFQRARDFEIIKDLSIQDVKNSLNKVTMNSIQLVQFLKWLNSALTTKSFAESDLTSLLSYAYYSPESGEYVKSLATFQYYKPAQGLPSEYPIPDNCLPNEVSAGFSSSKMVSLMGLQALPTEVQFMHIIKLAKTGKGLKDELNPVINISVSKVLFEALSVVWNGLQPNVRKDIKDEVADCSVIATQKGMLTPSKTYIDRIPAFPALPVVLPEVATLARSMLIYLGVRETVEPKYALSLIDCKETHISIPELVQYFVNQRKRLKEEDLRLLSSLSIFPRAGTDSFAKISELYSPIQSHIALDLPVLLWNGYDPGSDSAKFLVKLGLIDHIPIDKWSALVSQKNITPERRLKLLHYYFQNYDSKTYCVKSISSPIIPDNKGNLHAVNECFTDPDVECFGFPIVQSDIRREAWKLNIKEHPSTQQLIDMLMKSPPRTKAAANAQFSLMSKMVQQLSRADLNKLSWQKIVPLVNQDRFQAPADLFIENPDDNDPEIQFYKEIFDFVSFNSAANMFLMKCGARNKPDIVEIASSVVADPDRIYRLVGSPARYEQLLAQFSLEMEKLKKHKDLIYQMKKCKFLLGVSYTALNAGDIDGDATNSSRNYVLATPSDIVIVDDVVAFNLFRYEIISSPMHRILDSFYLKLGSRSVRDIYFEVPDIGPEIPEDKASADLKAQILERCWLYMESSPRDLKLKYSKLEKIIKFHFVKKIMVNRFLEYQGRKISKKPDSVGAFLKYGQEADLFISFPVDWFNLSRALVLLIHESPEPEYATVMEAVLQRPLTELEKRGYNVDRIIRRREAAQREQSEKLQAILQQENQKKAQVANAIPENVSSSPSVIEKKPVSLAKSEPKAPSNQLQKSSPLPKPPSGGGGLLAKSMKQTLSKAFNNSFGGNDFSKLMNNPATGKADASGIESTASSAMKMSKSHSGKDIVSPETLVQAEGPNVQNSLCDYTGSKNLTACGLEFGGISVYIPKDVHSMSDDTILKCEEFSAVLHLLSQVFDISIKSFHIFVDPHDRTMGFNYNKSLFFNAAYYGMDIKKSHYSGSASGGSTKKKALEFWFPIVCHEMAHNIAPQHGQQHSYISESIVQYNIGRFAELLSTIQ
ncbi:hypothetical protein CANCADRAFT_31206 [Tortispora caseinolytica NRRL Y-17796]|uniref:Sacsin/Nov domain-containing protein n=1 Tax=Tortispora caseinolytica NRRL Y-17796 TaxID=767744 RepID=A0A1E4TEK8_9ASCO|nr:hypothetical protein CANCADRAFT_31206 [Tortispora caseinolytica NRRL Y-17796]